VYQLWSNDWIPVRQAQGPSRRSLLDVLAWAHSIRRLDPTDAVVEVSLFRLLLAIVIDVQGPQSFEQWNHLWIRGRFEPSLYERYAAQVASRFDLLDPSAPFYQVGDLAAASGEVKSGLLLIPEAASGNNVPLFSVATEARVPRIPIAEAACRLVALQATDVAGIKTGAVGDPGMSAGKTTGNPVGPLGQIGVTIPMGRNLFESLMLSIPPSGFVPEWDAPAWRRPVATAAWETRPSDGMLDLLTWQARRVRLIADDDANPTSVVGIVVAAGDRLEGIDPLHEPHTAWQAADAAHRRMSQRPVRLQSGKTSWQGMDSLLAVDNVGAWALAWAGQRRSAIGARYPLDVRMVGVVYGNQSAVIEHVVSDSLPMSVLALGEGEDAEVIRRELLGASTKADSIRKALNSLSNNLRNACGGASLPWNKGSNPGDSFVAAIDSVTRRFVADCRDHPEEVKEHVLRWEQLVRDVALSIALPLIRQVPPRAFSGGPADPGSKYPPMNQARAEGLFRRDLNKTLAMAFDHERDEMRNDND